MSTRAERYTASDYIAAALLGLLAMTAGAPVLESALLKGKGIAHHQIFQFGLDANAAPACHTEANTGPEMRALRTE